MVVYSSNTINSGNWEASQPDLDSLCRTLHANYPSLSRTCTPLLQVPDYVKYLAVGGAAGYVLAKVLGGKPASTSPGAYG
jgi:hypothetical protein